jgi:hypothetical protein
MAISYVNERNASVSTLENTIRLAIDFKTNVDDDDPMHVCSYLMELLSYDESVFPCIIQAEFIHMNKELYRLECACLGNANDANMYRIAFNQILEYAVTSLSEEENPYQTLY